MLIFQTKRTISSEKRFYYNVTFFFFEDATKLGRLDDTKQRKKRGWPYWLKIMLYILHKLKQMG